MFVGKNQVKSLILLLSLVCVYVFTHEYMFIHTYIYIIVFFFNTYGLFLYVHSSNYFI